MANKKKKKNATSSSASVRSRTFIALLYPEWPNFASILAHMRQYNHAYCLHDEDIDEQTGEKKKPHVHVVLKFTGRRTLSSVKNEMKAYGVPENLMDTCNERSSLRYLIHKDNPEKHQYPLSDIQTNIPDAVHDAMNDEITSDEAFRILNKYIMESSKRITQAEMNMYALDNGLLKGLKAYGSQLNGARIEHNKEYDLISDIEDQIEKQRVRMKVASEDTLDKSARLVETFGATTIEINGKEYTLTQAPKKKNTDTDNTEYEQIDMLKEARRHHED